MQKINRAMRRLTSLTLCLHFFVPVYANASNEAGLAAAGISPTRIVVPSNQKSASITLTNTSSIEIAYRMTLVEMGLDAAGNFGVLEENQIPDAQRSAKSVIRFSPRQVRLKPGASQVVRAIVRRSAIRTPGEYRSHLRLQALPVLSDGILQDSAAGDPVLVQSSAKIEVGVTIPVIVRQGPSAAEVKLEEVKLDFDKSGNASAANLLLGLKGNRSAYGDISVSLVNNGSEKHLGRLRAFALYYPYPQEWVNVELLNPVTRAEVGPNSRIRVRFENRSVDSTQQNWLDDSVRPSLHHAG